MSQVILRWRGWPVLLLAGACTFGLSLTEVAAQLPQARLYSVFPAGGQAGTSLELTLANGTDLDDASRLIFNHPGIKAEQKTTEANGQKTPVANTFVVSIDPTVPNGIYEVRFGGRFGVSNSRSFVVGSINEVVEVEPNNSKEQATAVELNSTINARADGSSYDFYKFTGKAGQRVIVWCQAGRIDSKHKPVIDLHDSTGRRLGFAPRVSTRRDSLLDVALPADGEYFIRLIDHVYAGGNDHFYRLTLTTGPYIDFAMPPGGVAGSNTQITLYGRNLPGGQPAGVSVDGRPLEKVAVSVNVPADVENLPLADNLSAPQGAQDAFTYVWNSPSGNSNPVTLFAASAAVGLEQEPNDAPAQANKIAVPTEVAGQFQSRGDVDYFTFDAKAQEVYWIEAFGDRSGSQADPYLALDRITRDEKGTETVQRITAQDDTGTNLAPNFFETISDDPAFQFVVPADGTYRLSIRDRFAESRGDSRMVYRLAIRKESPDFRVVVVPEVLLQDNNQQALTWPASLRKGDNLHARVLAFRRDGFNGPIDVTAEGLPPGVTCKGTSIGPGQNASSLIFSCAEDAPEGFAFAKIVAKARLEDNVKVKAVADAKAALKRDTDALPKAQQDAAKAKDDEQKLLAVRQAAETKFNTDADLAKKAAAAKAAADKKTTDTAAALKAATDKLATAKADLDKDKDKQELKDAVAAAEKAVADTDTAAKAAAQEKSVADKATTDTANALKTSEQAKAKAVAEHDPAAAKLKTANEALAATTKKVADADAAVKAAIAAQQAAARDVAHAVRAGTLVWDGNQQTAAVARLSRQLCLAVTPEPHPFQITTDVFRVDANHNRQILVPVKLTKRNGYDENINLTFVGTPQNAQVENKAINKGQTEATFRIFLPNNVPVGTYTVYLKAQANNLPYRRRPELADKAKAALDQAVAVANQAQEALKTATEAKVAATKKATEADAAFKKATADKDAAAKKVAETTDAVKKATEAKDKATTDADKEATAKALTTAQDEAKKAAEALTAAEKVLADADAANKAALDAKTKSEAEAKAADDKNKAAQTDKQAQEKTLTDTNNATKANNVNVFAPSTVLVISVKPNAVNVTTQPANGGNVKKGDKVEVKVTIQRVNGFAGPVTLELVPPPNTVGLAAEKVMIPADKTEGAIIVTAAGDATEGQIANAVIRASAEFDGAIAASDGAVAINVQK